ncbi:MAG: methyltransferase domain-containing protein [Ancrocorticia sp.]
MQCNYFDADVCRSCTLMGTPYAEQVAAKEARVRELLSPWPELRWLAPFTSTESGFRNKAKLVVGGSAATPTLGILGSDGRGVDLRECSLYEPPLAAIFPALAEFVTLARLTPFDVPTGRGELKNIIASISPDGEFMVRFVLRSTESVVRIRKHLGWLQERIPGLVVATVNLLPERKAVPEGREEIVLTERDVLPMRLGRDSAAPGSGGLGATGTVGTVGTVGITNTAGTTSGTSSRDVTLYLRPQSFFQTNTPVARGLYEQARTWVDMLVGDDDEVREYERLRSIPRTRKSAAGSPHDDEVRGVGTCSHDRGQGSRLTPKEHDDEVREYERLRSIPRTRKSAAGSPLDAPPSSSIPAPDQPKTPLRLWDLYCGVGGFALHCAGPNREVFGVEISEQAIESARLAAHKLRDQAPGTGPIHFLAGDANAAARGTGGAPDVVVVNPPRRGIGKLSEWIENSSARHLIYSSCNPVTLAKDLAAMPGFVPREVRVFDMFPQTTHTETMVLASRRES